MIWPVVLVVCMQWLLGFGMVTRLKAVRNGMSLSGLSMLVGLGVSSLVPFIVEFAQLPITATPVFVGLGVLTGFSALLLQGQGEYLRAVFSGQRTAIRLYELPFLGFWAYLLFISAWKCAWFPNTPFDTIVGPDLVATAAVREQTLASSVFTEHLPLVSVFSNQPFYAPFTAMQQVIYLLAAQNDGPFVFGKIWLTVLVVGFGLWLYAELRERIHPLLAGVLITVLACTPELFSYTFLVQTDWANAAFFVVGVMLLQRYLASGGRGVLAGSALLMALACWTRTETIFFAAIGSLLLFVRLVRRHPVRAVVLAAGYSLAGLLPVLFWNYGFLRGYVPLPPQAHLGVIHGVTDGYVGKLLAVFSAMNKTVVFDADYWNYTVYIFVGLALLNLVLFRDKRGWITLVWLIGIYGLFGLIIQHVDGANVAYTFRRGFFKLLFLMYVYLADTTLVNRLSEWLYRWEDRAIPLSDETPAPPGIV
ncbi:hypothetical protein LQ777_11520 [Spirosoma oryzicola]|nr:hypothetical protein LQ777_11520 [Spirosoma oryzicola]